MPCNINGCVIFWRLKVLGLVLESCNQSVKHFNHSIRLFWIESRSSPNVICTCSDEKRLHCIWCVRIYVTHAHTYMLFNITRSKRGQHCWDNLAPEELCESDTECGTIKQHTKKKHINVRLQPKKKTPKPVHRWSPVWIVSFAMRSKIEKKRLPSTTPFR